MQRHVTFPSGENLLAGTLHIPDDLPAGERRPAIIVIHGFGGNSRGTTHVGECALYESIGYVALRFDMRGCGESGGTRDRILCLDQVEDARNAVTWLTQQECVRPDFIALSGQSFGGAVAMYAGATDERVAAVITIGGWGNGARKLAWQNRAPGAWNRLLSLLEQGRAMREATGETLMIDRWDIVPVPEEIRAHLPPGCTMRFPVDTPQSIHDFRPEEVVSRIAPRPFLVMHGAHDSVTHVDEAMSIFRASGGNAELVVLKGDHFPFVKPDPIFDGLLASWISQHLPLETASGSLAAS